MEASSRIAIIGFMGTGKSTIGRRLAEKTGLSFVDLDSEIEKSVGVSIPEIFELYGEGYFRNLELEFLKKYSLIDSLVLSTGGGIVEREEARETLRMKFFCIHLKADWSLVWSRIKEDKSRPKAQESEEVVFSLYNARMNLYNQIADFEMDVTFLSPEEATEKIIERLRNDY